MKTSLEQSITFNLVETKAKKGKDGKDSASRAYRAVLKHGPALSMDEVIEECVRDYRLPEHPLVVKRIVESVLESMVEHTLADGRNRSLGDYLTLRLDISGSFPRPDAAFDPARNALALSFQEAPRLRSMKRKTWPVNGQKRPFGKIDAVYSVGGEIGRLIVGRDIVIEGHDLKLVGQDIVSLFVNFKEGTFQYPCDVKENTDTRLVVAFPRSRTLKPDVLVGLKGQVARFGYSSSSSRKGPLHGRRANVTFVA